MRVGSVVRIDCSGCKLRETESTTQSVNSVDTCHTSCAYCLTTCGLYIPVTQQCNMTCNDATSVGPTGTIIK